MHTLESLTRLARWLCSKLCFDELLIVITILLNVVNDRRNDIKLRNYFQEKHPNYRSFYVDPEPPVIAEPSEPEVADYKQLLVEYRRRTGKELKPVRRHKKSQLPPHYARCERCNAPAKYLYANNGHKKSQLRCKVCNNLFPSHRIRKESNIRYRCPYCGWALYQWKNNDIYTIFKCRNNNCYCYINNLEKLNIHEKELQKTGMNSQFKLRYQYREYHYTPADLQTVRPDGKISGLNRINNPFNTLGLTLAYSVSYGLSSRMTCRILRDVHNIRISHQTVINYQEKAAGLAHNFFQKYIGPMSDKQIAGDETYIRIYEQWHYTWFIVGAKSRAIRAFNISDKRDVLSALATMTQAMKYATENLDVHIDFIGDGNPSYDAAVHAFNADNEGKPLKRRKVIGISNDDDESKLYRPFKQLIERLNRTYKFHTRARCGFKNFNGAVVLTTLFVAYYNFIRPHTALKYKTPINVPELEGISTIQGKWLKLLELAA